jgi:hypothetical protein
MELMQLLSYHMQKSQLNMMELQEQTELLAYQMHDSKMKLMELKASNQKNPQN